MNSAFESDSTSIAMNIRIEFRADNQSFRNYRDGMLQFE